MSINGLKYWSCTYILPGTIVSTVYTFFMIYISKKIISAYESFIYNNIIYKCLFILMIHKLYHFTDILYYRLDIRQPVLIMCHVAGLFTNISNIYIRFCLVSGYLIYKSHVKWCPIKGLLSILLGL